MSDRLEQLSKKGFVVDKSFFSDEDLCVLKNRITEYARAILKKPSIKDFDDLTGNIHLFGKNRSFFFDVCQLAPEINQLCYSPKIAQLLESLQITNPILKNTNIRLDIPDECDFFLVDWHQDLNNLDSEKSFTIWIPLCDINDHTGGVTVIEQEQFMEKYWEGNLNKDGYETVEVNKIPNSTEKKVYMSYGDILIFNPFLVHKSFKGTKLPRWTLILRFDCLDKFYNITGAERKTKRFTTTDPYLKSKNAQSLY